MRRGYCGNGGEKGREHDGETARFRKRVVPSKRCFGTEESLCAKKPPIWIEGCYSPPLPLPSENAQNAAAACVPSTRQPRRPLDPILDQTKQKQPRRVLLPVTRPQGTHRKAAGGATLRRKGGGSPVGEIMGSRRTSLLPPTRGSGRKDTFFVDQQYTGFETSTIRWTSPP